MATEEEKKIARAYNVGAILSTYEPKLLEQIIKHNKSNEFVKTMEIAKEHHEFNAGIPKKEFDANYKNGFKNASALSEHEPELLDKLANNPDMNKDYIRGLKAGKKEYEVRQVMKRIQQEREQQQQRSIGRDKGIEY